MASQGARIVCRIKRWPVSVFQIATEFHVIDREVGSGHVYLRMKTLVLVRVVGLFYVNDLKAGRPTI